MISVIVPVYNVEGVLHYCIDSILAQSFSEFELILVDDGSSDGSGILCDEYAARDKRITVIHKENGGVSSARNTGIKASSGDYICFIDSDDYIAKNYLEELINTQDSFPDFDNIWCGFKTVSDYNGSGSRAYLASENEKFSEFNKTEIMTLHEKWLSQMPWNKLYKSLIIKENQIEFPENLSLGEDLLFNLRYLDCTSGRIAIINRPLNNYVCNGNESLDNKYYPDLFEIYKEIYSILFTYLQKWNCDNKQIKSYYNSYFFSLERVLRNTFSPHSQIKKKYQYNREIMKSDVFKEALHHSDCYVHPLYRFCYRIASYRLVECLDRITIKNN